jgi:hypothetical protein
LLQSWPLLLLLLVVPNKRSILITKNQGVMPCGATLQLRIATTFVVKVGWRRSTVISEALDEMKLARLFSGELIYRRVEANGFGDVGTRA